MGKVYFSEDEVTEDKKKLLRKLFESLGCPPPEFYISTCDDRLYRIGETREDDSGGVTYVLAVDDSSGGSA